MSNTVLFAGKVLVALIWLVIAIIIFILLAPVALAWECIYARKARSETLTTFSHFHEDSGQQSTAVPDRRGSFAKEKCLGVRPPQTFRPGEVPIEKEKGNLCTTHDHEMPIVRQ